MEIFRYIGKKHNVFCNWQGHSNGRLRIKGRHKDKDIEFVFSVSCYKFYFYIVKVKGVRFRSLMLHGLSPIFFSSKSKREMYFMQQRINRMEV